MFPFLYLVETVVCLTRKNVDGYIDIDLDIEKIENNGGNASYSEIKQYIKDKYDLNVSTLYIAQIKDKLGLEKRDNYNFGEGKSKHRYCPKEKEDAIMDAFKHFGMI